MEELLASLPSTPLLCHGGERPITSCQFFSLRLCTLEDLVRYAIGKILKNLGPPLAQLVPSSPLELFLQLALQFAFKPELFAPLQEIEFEDVLSEARFFWQSSPR